METIIIPILSVIIVVGIVATIIVQSKKYNKSKNYFISQFSRVKVLAKSYYDVVLPYLDKIKSCDNTFFTKPFSKSNILISKYWETAPLLLKCIFKYDGFIFEKHYALLPNEEKAYHLAQSVISELTNCISEKNEWLDKPTLPCLIYFIIRNAIISKYFFSEKIIPKGKENYAKETANDRVAPIEQSQSEAEYENESEAQSQSSSTYFWAKNNPTTNSQNAPTSEEEQIIFVDDEETQRKAREDLLKEQELERKRKQEWEQYKREKEERERLERERIQKEKEEQERKSLEYLDQNKNRLISKYSGTVENFIRKLEDNGCAPFLEMFSDSEIPLSSILIYPYSEEIQYKESATRLLQNKILRDGLKFTKSTNEALNSKIQELTDFFIKGLKKRIIVNNEWSDEYTFFVLLYLIVRNNIIKYYHDKYIEKLGYESLEEFCEYISNALSRNADIFAYTYYYIYETNIDLPFVDTYHNICLDIKYTIAAQREKKLEDDLFGTPKMERAFTPMDNSSDLSAIQKIDLMSGEEFEIFMEEYFTQRGYKVTRTPLSGDYGIDLIIEHEFGKVGVQAKCYSNKVSLPAVQEVVAGLRHYGLSSGMVITNNYFQSAAIRLAKDNNIELWDRDKLIEKLG